MENYMEIRFYKIKRSKMFDTGDGNYKIKINKQAINDLFNLPTYKLCVYDKLKSALDENEPYPKTFILGYDEKTDSYKIMTNYKLTRKFRRTHSIGLALNIEKVLKNISDNYVNIYTPELLKELVSYSGFVDETKNLYRIKLILYIMKIRKTRFIYLGDVKNIFTDIKNNKKYYNDIYFYKNFDDINEIEKSIINSNIFTYDYYEFGNKNLRSISISNDEFKKYFNQYKLIDKRVKKFLKEYLGENHGF